MTARTHDLIGFAALLTIAALYPPESLTVPTLGAALVGNVVGSLIPDIDQASNRLWDLLPAGDELGKVFRKAFLKHRTITHSFLGVFLIYKILFFILPKILNPNYVDWRVVFVSMMVGYIAHLAADMLTKDGLPLFFPLKFKFGFPPLSTFRVTTGSWMENLVIFPGTIAYIFWFIGKNQKIFFLIFHSLELK